jgi:hypothetical protein
MAVMAIPLAEKLSQRAFAHIGGAPGTVRAARGACSVRSIAHRVI